KRNMLRLIRMCRQHQIIPIVGSNYPNNNYTSVHYRYIKQIMKEFDALGVAQFNFLGAADDLTGNWLPGSYTDAAHPNEVGHEAMFRAIPPSIFDNLVDWNDTLKTTE